MLKSELILRLAEKKPHIPVRTINNSVKRLIQLMSDSLAENQRIEIRGFGSFSTKTRSARDAHNPKTGEKMQTSEKFCPHFKPGKNLKDRINASRNSHALQPEEG